MNQKLLGVSIDTKGLSEIHIRQPLWGTLGWLRRPILCANGGVPWNTADSDGTAVAQLWVGHLFIQMVAIHVLEAGIGRASVPCPLAVSLDLVAGVAQKNGKSEEAGLFAKLLV